MGKKFKGIAPLLVILIVAAGLVGGTAAGYGMREKIKKAFNGKTTADEIQEAIDEEITKLDKDKFELEGVVASVDVSASKITVKIKSSTNSIKELRLSETPVEINSATKISFNSEQNLKIGDIPINSQVHVGGTLSDGKLTAAKVIVQKEDASEGQGERKNKEFEIGGAIKAVEAGQIVVGVTSASRSANSQKGKDLTIKITSSTMIEKNNQSIEVLSLEVDDQIEVEGIVENDVYTASKIEVSVEEEAGELEEETDEENGEVEQNQNQNHSNNGNSSSEDKNKEKEDD